MAPADFGAPDESSRIADVVLRLEQRFPQLPAGRVEDVVREVRREFEGAAVRDFVPILVEKRAREELEGTQPAPVRV